MYRLGPRPLVAALAAVGLLSACGDAGCKNAPTDEATSPGGSYRAVVFQRDCGATTAATTQVALIAASDSLPNAVGNIMVSDDPFPAHVTWRGSNELVIRYDRAARISKRVPKKGPVSVTYVPALRPTPAPDGHNSAVHEQHE